MALEHGLGTVPIILTKTTKGNTFFPSFLEEKQKALSRGAAPCAPCDGGMFRSRAWRIVGGEGHRSVKAVGGPVGGEDDGAALAGA